MKIFLIALLFCFETTFAQTDTTTYLKELGWTIRIPVTFDGQFPILKFQHGDSMKRLVGVVKGRDAMFIVKIDTANFFTTLDWEKKDSIATDVAFKVVERSAPYKLDTTNSIIDYDGVQFKKRVGIETITRKESWHIVSLRSFYKGYYFTVSYTYQNETTGSEIDRMLSASRFEK